MSLGWPHALIALVAAQRVIELAYGRRNARALIARGGKESGGGHYWLLVGFHAGWLLALSIFTAPQQSVPWTWIVAFAVLQLLRLWTIASLGLNWTTRIITIDGTAPVIRGPYRYLRHPNYTIVALEVPVLSMAVGLPWVAVLFGLTNGMLLLYRVSVENAALERARRAIAAG